MPRHSLAVFASILLAPALLAPRCVGAAPKLWQREWLEIETEHFVIASALSEERSIALAVELENFRVLASKLLTKSSAQAFEERIPTKVYLFPNAVPDLGLSGSTGGYFVSGMRANYALIRSLGNDSDEVIKHEYTHFLAHNLSSQLYPRWFDEGFAELMSTLTARYGVVEYGKPIAGRVDTLRRTPWMSFPSLLATRDVGSLGNREGPFFYAQSWFLVQYLMVGRDGHSFAAEATDYLRRSEAGAPPVEAFRAAFGLEPEEIEHTLVAYFRKMRFYRAKLVEPLPTVTPTVRRLGVDEIAAQLGLLALIRGEYEGSERYYAAALAANPNNAVALAGMGDIHKQAQRYDEAEQHYSRAVAAEPTNGNHELDWGEYYLQRAAAEKDQPRRRALLIEARRHFARSYAVNPANPETLDQNAQTYMFDGEDPAKAVESLEAAHELLPSQYEIQFDLAKAYVRADRPDPARTLLNRLLAWSHTGAVESIRQLLATLESTTAAEEPATPGGQIEH